MKIVDMKLKEKAIYSRQCTITMDKWVMHQFAILLTKLRVTGNKYLT